MQEELRFSQQQWCHEDSVVEAQCRWSAVEGHCRRSAIAVKPAGNLIVRHLGATNWLLPTPV